MKDYYVDCLKKMHETYHQLFNKLTEFVAKVDYIKSNAKTAVLYNYTRPKIITNNSKKSFIRCKQLRHPIVERINETTEYVPHDISLGINKDIDDCDIDGMLIFGVNGVGKTVIMKAIGLVVVMAQSGMFVPATNFNYYPYQSLFARITGNDNIFKGLSFLK